MMDKKTLHQTNAYNLLLLRSNNLIMNRHIYNPLIVKTMKTNLELMVKANMVNLWITQNWLSYCYIKPDETQIDIQGAPKKNYDSN